MTTDNNFYDPQTGEEFYISSFRIVTGTSGVSHKTLTGKPLTNPSNGNVLKEIPRDPNKPIGVPYFLKSNNKESLNKMLKDRSKEHFKKEISEQKYDMNKKLVDKYNDK